MKLIHDKYEIEIIDDKYYLKSSNNSRNYEFVYSAGKITNSRLYTINKRAVIVRGRTNGEVLASSILCENGGKTTINEDIYEIENDRIWICVGDKMYGLNIPDLSVHCFISIDLGANHSINKFKNDFVAFGDSALVRFTKSGEIKWSYLGEGGVFVPGEGNLKIFDDHIELIDGNRDKFVINEFGEKIN